MRVPENFMLSDSKSTILPEAGPRMPADTTDKETGRFQGEKALKPDELRNLF